MDKVAKLQMQIKENSNELNDFLQDLTKWEENIKQEDEQLRTTRRIDEKVIFFILEFRILKSHCNH